MDKIIIHHVNESYIKLECERYIAMELHEHFAFFVPNYQFSPKYKNRLWDGKIKLFNLYTHEMYRGLIPYIERFCKDRNYILEKDERLTPKKLFTTEDCTKFLSKLNLPIEPRDYQINAFMNAINNKRQLIISPTASGKSLIIYLIIRLLQVAGLKKGLLIVPNTSLCYQMFDDFKSYGYESENNCHIIHSGKNKNSDMFLNISTWQSIYELDEDYFKQYDFVINDEVHLAKAKSITTILEKLINARYRIGCTGTLDNSKTYHAVLEGLFGSQYRTISTKELIDNGALSKFKIKCIVLKHPPLDYKKWEYKDEIDYLVRCPYRNRYIKNLALSLKGNTLLLFQYVEKHGNELYKIINGADPDRKVFFIHGSVDVNNREEIRKIVETETNAIIIASYGTYSTGINIKNLHNVIFASPSKSIFRNLQSIGRVLRKGSNKDEAILYDIADDLRNDTDDKLNYTLTHLIERVKIYDGEKFNYKIYNIEVK